MCHYANAGAGSFISSSGGNAGLAVAFCASKLGVEATIFIPDSTAGEIRNKLRAYGANVIVEGTVWNEADVAARDNCRRGSVYVSPFDDPFLWEGHSTMIDEAAQQVVKPGAVVLSVGGGGLLCGVLNGMHRNSWADVPVVAVETEGAASFAAAVNAGKPVTLSSMTSIAKSLGALQVCDEAFGWTSRHEIRSAVLSDQAAIVGCHEMARHFRVLVEPACGVSLAAIIRNHPALQDCDNVLLIACGGASVNHHQSTTA